MSITAGMTPEEVIDRYERMKAAAKRLREVNPARIESGLPKLEVTTWNASAILEAPIEDMIEFGLILDTEVIVHGSMGEREPTKTGRTRHARNEEPTDTKVCGRCQSALPIRKFPTTKAGRRGDVCRACRDGGAR